MTQTYRVLHRPVFGRAPRRKFAVTPDFELHERIMREHRLTCEDAAMSVPLNRTLCRLLNDALELAETRRGAKDKDAA